MQAEFSVLEKRVFDVAQKSAIGKRLKRIVLEADQDNEGSDFLRVILEVKPLDGVSDADIEAMVESIEKAIGDIDERFPSVRIADAA